MNKAGQYQPRGKWTPLPRAMLVATCSECHRTSCRMGVFPCAVRKNGEAGTRMRSVSWCVDEGYEHTSFLTVEYRNWGAASSKNAPSALPDAQGAVLEGDT